MLLQLARHEPFQQLRPQLLWPLLLPGLVSVRRHRSDFVWGRKTEQSVDSFLCPDLVAILSGRVRNDRLVCRVGVCDVGFSVPLDGFDGDYSRAPEIPLGLPARLDTPL